jgi:hypothetical protein
MAMLVVDGHAISRDPAEMSWGLQPVNASDAGRTQDGTMHTNRVTVKRKISLTWNIVHQEQATEILQAFFPEYVSVLYFDPLDGKNETRTFYTGDMSAPFRSYKVPVVGGTTFKTISFDIIEV